MTLFVMYTAGTINPYSAGIDFSRQQTTKLKWIGKS